jgi:hypothetical protein
MNAVSAGQFVVFRIALGAYFVGFGTLLLPYAPELLSDQGILEHYWRGFRLFAGALPNVLEYDTSPAIAYAVVAAMIASGIGISLGLCRRTCALVAWYTLACVVNRNAGLANPSIPFVGWLCFATVIVPLGEGTTIRLRSTVADWAMPPALFRAAWIVMAVAYSVSGIAKLSTPEWLDGSALAYVMELPFAREGGPADVVRSLPDAALRLMTWLALFGEVAFAPLSLFRAGRAIAWTIMVAMHLMLLATMDFAELTAGMFLIHIFTFDRRWLG